MTDALTAGIGAQQALTQQKVALSLIKKNAEVGQQIANMVQQGANNVAASSRGSIVNITA